MTGNLVFQQIVILLHSLSNKSLDFLAKGDRLCACSPLMNQRNLVSLDFSKEYAHISPRRSPAIAFKDCNGTVTNSRIIPRELKYAASVPSS